MVLLEIVEALPESQLVVINGLFWECISQGELARRLAISQQAVSKRRRRALAHIERALNNGGHP